MTKSSLVEGVFSGIALFAIVQFSLWHTGKPPELESRFLVGQSVVIINGPFRTKTAVILDGYLSVSGTWYYRLGVDGEKPDRLANVAEQDFEELNDNASRP